MVQLQKYLISLLIVLLCGNVMESKDLESVYAISQPLENDPKDFLDVNNAESKDHLSKNLPEGVLLGVIADQYTKPDTLKSNDVGSEPVKSVKEEPNAKNPDDVPDDATASIERGETENISQIEKEIFDNQVEHAGNIKDAEEPVKTSTVSKSTENPVSDKPKHSGHLTTLKAAEGGQVESTTKPKGTDSPVTDKSKLPGHVIAPQAVKEKQAESTAKPKPTEDSVTDKHKFPGMFFAKNANASEEPATEVKKELDSLTTVEPKVVSQGKPEKTGIKVDRESVKNENSESNAMRDLSLACFILNFMMVIATSNTLYF